MVNYLSDLITLRKSLNYSKFHKIEDINDSIEATHLESGLLIIKVKNKTLLSQSEEAVIVINPTEQSIPYDLDDYYTLFFSSSGFVKGKHFFKNFISAQLTVDILVK